jgi:hypothetical protein
MRGMMTQGVDEMVYRSDGIPSECANGHTSYPMAFRLGSGRVTLGGTVGCGPCPQCLAARVIAAGTYQAGPEGVRKVGDQEGQAIAPSGDRSGAADTAAIEEALRRLPEVGHDGPMRYSQAQREQIAADGAGKTVQSLEWEADGAYWSMIFTDGTEMSFRFMAEIGG